MPYPPEPAGTSDIVLVDLLDRLLDRGVVIQGDAVLSVADVDLLYVSLRVLVASVASVEGHGGGNGLSSPAGR